MTERSVCRNVREEIPGYLGGEVDGETWQWLSDHLRECASCHAELQTFERLEEMLRESFPVEKPSPDLVQRFSERLARSTVQKPSLIDRITAPLREALRTFEDRIELVLVPVGAAAAVAVLAVSLSTGPSPGPDQTAAPLPKPPSANSGAVESEGVRVVAEQESPAGQEAPESTAPKVVVSADEEAERLEVRDAPEESVKVVERHPSLFLDYGAVKHLDELERQETVADATTPEG